MDTRCHRYFRFLSLASILIFLGSTIAEEIHQLIPTHHKVRHERQKRQHFGFYFHQNFTVGPHDPTGDSGEWGPFSESSECSRSCGGGVAFQTRICLDMRSDASNPCIGPSKRYFSCNIQDCPEGTKDFREEQCSRFNSLPFQGKYYSWFPYMKAANPCELNCKPKGERFYYMHDKKVIDGTRCREGSLDICVEGVCMPVGCDMILGSEAKEDKCRDCGGDGSGCDTLEGIFDHDNMKVGYNDIILIPSGATNVRIEEKYPTNNYVAVRSLDSNYYLNGNWKIDYPRDMKFAGTVFHYERKASAYMEPEKLWALGPTNEPIYIVLLYQEKNQGIVYEYSIPKGISSNLRADRYTWTVGDYERCSVTCGGGIQRRPIACSRASDYETVDHFLCDPNQKPEYSRTCNDHPCNALWEVGEWLECVGTGGCSGGDKGKQFRQVTCQQHKDGNLPSLVSEEVCKRTAAKPPYYQDCEIDQKGCPEWVLGPWSACNKPCGEGKQTRKVTCKAKKSSESETTAAPEKSSKPPNEGNGKPFELEMEFGGEEDEDNVEGGEKGEESADNTEEELDDSECEQAVGSKPPVTQSCTVGPCEGVEWITTPWTGCSSNCGLFLESREVFCATEEGKLFPGDLCDPKKIPKLTQECPEKTECKAMWHASEWSECSAKCGLGVQTRVVFCGEWQGDTLKKKDETSCDPSKKMAIHQNCTRAPCEGQWFTGPFGRCTTNCGGGFKTRPILCIQEEEVIGSKNCDPGAKPLSKDVCNDQSCDDDDLMIIGGCKESTHGCCPDGINKAGLNYAGCPKEKLPDGKTCHETDFGCCADGITPALGTFKKGCPPIRSCNDTEFGCCPDGVTPAKSSNTDDCPEVVDCNKSLYGCCPDGVVPAVGDNFTGCENIPVSGCELSSFGCCPDGVTAAEGLDSEGCDQELGSGEDCTLTTHGCCTDGLTAASGPEYLGCPLNETSCTNSSFGCCPDGVTVAEDEDGLNCEDGSGDSALNCTESFFGCCPDNATNAKGPEYEGCENCTFTEFGCCRDNITAAAGPDFEGCESEDNCTLSEFGCCQDNITVAVGPDFEGCESEDNCTLSEFGCCPDNITLAIGPDMEGCNDTVSDNCTETEFGCCSDNVTLAIGPDMEGCEPTEEPPSTTPAPCNNMLYGCCPDGATPARGPNNLWCCYYSEFGCCPDNTTEAKGQNWGGCACHTSKFGCCPNGIQLAKGPRYYGCTCETYPFGCCQDNYYPAQGPNYEGCNCLIMRYGCCSDGRTPASGPEQEGCGCSTSQFGCCGDNVTPAIGPRYEGCPCGVMPFGCCPDGVTVSRGPNYEGCPCSTMQFGCCRDNITPARGANGEGCECEYAVHGCCPDRKNSAIGSNYQGCPCDTLPYGCCPDGQTASRGPGYRGCPCESSPFQCCPDGVTLAQGPNHEGCGQAGQPPSRPPVDVVVPREVCSLPSERGPCRNYTVMWFFDMTYGGCSRFWYGGCDGNGNSFNTQDECENVCVTPEGADACQLPKVAGSCKDNQTLWHFDMSSDTCQSFEYSGCLGNNNRFATKELCDETCVKKETLDICEQPMVTGPCGGYYTRHYYDQVEATCKRFIYGGCKGNDNNFETEPECRQTCATVGDVGICALPREDGNCREQHERVFYDYSDRSCKDFVYTGCGGNRNRFVTKEQCQKVCNESTPVAPTGSASSRAICRLAKDAGPCSSLSIKWYFNEENQRCEQFYYGGCDGNENRFENRDDCESACVVEAPQPERNVCLLPYEVGTCQEFRERWYHDAGTGTCRRFHFSGCGGNQNNFDSYQTCENRCGRPASTELPVGMFKTEYCFLEHDAGPCTTNDLRWYYDRTDGVCKEFYYGGCQGNGNRFRTRGECETKCSDSQDVCQLPEVRGPCSGNFTQWRYVPDNDECVSFIFGGCQGNANRFNDKDSCQIRCEKEIATTTLPPQEVCSLPVEQGPCLAYFRKFYYNPAERRCVEFVYGGCQGNGNNFADAETCERTCQHFQPEPPPPSPPPLKEVTTVETVDEDEPASNQEVCRKPMEKGPCKDDSPRWFYNPESGTCLPFVYGGCGGNKNRFKTFDICIRFCTGISPIDENEVVPHERPPVPGQCHPNNCGELWCPYGTDENRDEHTGCVVSCSCYNPCKNFTCPPGQRCALEVTRNVDGEPVPVPECRLITKPGRCPAGPNGEYAADQPQGDPRPECQDYCREDADCRANQKCCLRGCAHICVQPVEVEIVLEPERPRPLPPTTTEEPTTTVTTPEPEPLTPSRQGVDEVYEEEKEVLTVAGSDVTIQCRVREPLGLPQWSKDESHIDGSTEPRITVQSDGSLYINKVRGEDSGVYTCVVRIRLGPPATRSYKLVVHVPAQILPSRRTVFAKADQPKLLVCRAVGSPAPSVSWWFGKAMLPFSSSRYQQFSDYSLLIRSVTVRDVGTYQCRAYNGLGDRAQFSVSLVLSEDQNGVQAEVQSGSSVIRTRIYSRTSRDTDRHVVEDYRTNQTSLLIAASGLSRLEMLDDELDPVGDVGVNGGGGDGVGGGESVAVEVTVVTPDFRVGHPIQMDCRTKGFPPGQVSLEWYRGKETETIEADDHYEILENGTLIISNSSVRDSGYYRCEASSDYGLASSSVSLAIEEIFIPADCTDNPLFAKCELIVKARYCNSPYYGRYCCRTCRLAGQSVVRPRTPYNAL